jgi:lysophospholipase L1-like esterase
MARIQMAKGHWQKEKSGGQCLSRRPGRRFMAKQRNLTWVCRDCVAPLKTDADHFMKPGIVQLLFAIVTVMSLSTPAHGGDSPPAIFKKDARILFQGDSITDGGRGRNSDPNHILGHGYVYLIAANYGGHHPERNLTFINRGFSGNKMPDLAARWQKDTIALKPDVLSILIGINDVWHNLDENKEIPFEQFEHTYDKLMGDTMAALPGVKIVLCEPFMLPGSATKARWNEWETAVKKMQQIVERLGAKYKMPVVHFQKVFDDACKRVPAERWIWDGVHPTYAGHQLMADEWVHVVRKTWRR